MGHVHTAPLTFSSAFYSRDTCSQSIHCQPCIRASDPEGNKQHSSPVYAVAETDGNDGSRRSRRRLEILGAVCHSIGGSRVELSWLQARRRQPAGSQGNGGPVRRLSADGSGGPAGRSGNSAEDGSGGAEAGRRLSRGCGGLWRRIATVAGRLGGGRWTEAAHATIVAELLPGRVEVTAVIIEYDPRQLTTR